VLPWHKHFSLHAPRTAPVLYDLEIDFADSIAIFYFCSFSRFFFRFVLLGMLKKAFTKFLEVLNTRVHPFLSFSGELIGACSTESYCELPSELNPV
jgi:hypothetical protein